SRRTIVPHEFVDMATFHTTEIGTMNVQVRIGGDLALLRGVAKALFEAAEKNPDVLDREFIERHTHGIDEYRALVESTAWADLARLRGVAKARFEAAEKNPDVLDREFIERHTHGIDEYRALVESTAWADLARDAGVDEPAIRKLADSYMASKHVIIAWCLGLTQHEHGVDTVREIVHLLLLRGTLVRAGAGPSPIR